MRFYHIIILLFMSLQASLWAQTAPPPPRTPPPVLLQAEPINAISLSQQRVKEDFTCKRLFDTALDIRGTVPSEAGSFENWAMLTSYSYARIDDEIIPADARHNEGNISFTANYGNNILASIGIGYGQYEYFGPDRHDLRLEDTYLETVVLYQISEHFAIGPFLEFSEVDMDTNWGADDNQTTVATGLLGTSSYRYKNTEVGLSGALASMNKRNFREIWDNDNTAVAGMLDLTQRLTNRFSVGTYGYYFSLLDNQRGTDGHYWVVGTEVGWQLSEKAHVSLAYSNYLANKSYAEERSMVNFSWLF